MAAAALGVWARRWLDGHASLKPSTRFRYESLLRVQVLPTWGSVRLGDVELDGVETWLAKLTASGLAASTVRQAFRVLHLVLEHAVRARKLARNPATGASLPAARPADKRFLGHEEVARLADAAGSYSLAIRVLAFTGVRFGELAALRVGRVDLLRRRLHIAESVTEVNGASVFGSPKTHRVRSVPISRSLADELTEHLAGQPPEAFVFAAPGGGVLRVGNFRARVFDPAARAAGLDGLTPHDLRHTAASLAVASGANVKAVQLMLGHASAAMTLDVYSHLFDDGLDAVADRLDEAAARARADSLRTGSAVVPLRAADTSF